ALRDVRLFLVSLLPNLLPMVFALAFAIWLGIPIRIGTAMVLAIALGIAVDDTIHMMMRLKRELLVQKNEYEAVRASLKHTGAAVLFTTAVLVMGFITMLSNELLAIQDMGILAAGTLFVAFLSDVYLAPALFLLTRPRSSRPAPTYFPVRLGRSIRSSAGDPRRFIANNLSTGNHLNTLNREGDR
ncbi:MAG: MMPL family transporter, partial [Bacteroidetes bacterium]|nr:MMPL family transporter [Bacteroidota bacterium]